jgi:hypothetical protein
MRDIELNAEARRTWLRLEQGLPVEPTDGHTVVRQSDFEKSKIWRAVFIAAVITAGVALFQPAPATAPASTTPTRMTA